MKARVAAAITAGLAATLIPSLSSATVWPFVDVPRRYVYDPSKGSLHDYCTKSPDSWDRADFRGPCANHDLCYGDHVRGKQACDDSLRDDLQINCGFAFDQDGGHKDRDKFETCWKIAATYHHWVQRKGDY